MQFVAFIDSTALRQQAHPPTPSSASADDPRASADRPRPPRAWHRRAHKRVVSAARQASGLHLARMRFLAHAMNFALRMLACLKRQRVTVFCVPQRQSDSPGTGAPNVSCRIVKDSLSNRVMPFRHPSTPGFPARIGRANHAALPLPSGRASPGSTQHTPSRRAGDGMTPTPHPPQWPAGLRRTRLRAKAGPPGGERTGGPHGGDAALPRIVPAALAGARRHISRPD